MFKYRRSLLQLVWHEAKQPWKMAEIGVYRSDLLMSMMRSYSERILEYWAVDPWLLSGDPKGLYVPDAVTTQEDWDNLHLDACEWMLQYVSAVRIVRAASVDAAKLFSRGYFDFVFLDGNHTFEAVDADIKAWLPLVKPGGILAGHDYNKRHWGLKKAVCQNFGVDGFETLRGSIWLVRVPDGK